MSPDPQRTAMVSDGFNIRGQAQGGIARIMLEQRFQNP